MFKPAEEMISPYGLPEDAALAQERKDDLHALFNYLPEHYRTILYLREAAEFSYAEIATAMDLSVDQVKVTLYRSRKKLETIAKQKGWHDDRME